MSHELNLAKDLSRADLYKTLFPQIKSLIQDEYDLIANLANISAALAEGLKVLWIGFYIRKDKELVLGPFQGPVACTRIQVEPTPCGVCGAAAVKRETIIVPDVDKFPGHIVCSSRSKSEIVVPLVVHNETALVLDIDSEKINDFSQLDREGLERIVELLRDYF